jgi:hypothetical protein
MKLDKLKIFFLISFCIFNLYNCNNAVSKSQYGTTNSNGDKIFVSESFLKHKKTSLKAKQIETAINPRAKMDSSTINDSVSSDSDLGRNTNLLELAKGSQNKSTPPDINIGQGPVFYQGWVKYFKYSDIDIIGSTPKQFFRNNEFFEQMKKNSNLDLNEKVDGMYSNIKNNSFFFAILFSQTLNIVTSRDTKIQKTYDSLNIDWISPVNESMEMDGGVSDFGNFNEGYCIKIVSNKAKIINWVICLETETEKNNFISILKKLKIKRQ